jgi:hypothetical protein
LVSGNQCGNHKQYIIKKIFMSIHVTTVDQLYDAVNDPANAGKKIVLATGIYVLDAKSGRPNAGRLELLEDMELEGQPGHPEKVVIDTSQLPGTSFNPPNNFPAARTGAIRMGRGINTIQWLKVIGNSNSQPLSVIDSDLIWNGISRIKIAHTIITGGRIGIDIRNVGAASIGRTIEAELVGNELVANLVSDPGTQQGQGIVIQNANGASRAIIKVMLNGNYIHGNVIGMRVFNNNGNANIHTDKASISIQSNADKFDENKLGIYMVAGSNRGANSTVNGNVLSFEAHGTSIQNNKGILPDPITNPCGIYLTGGSSSLIGADASDNKLKLKLNGCKFSGNENKDIIAFGAFSTVAIPAGTNNIVNIHLQGESKKAITDSTPCKPAEPAGTNKVNLFI